MFAKLLENGIIDRDGNRLSSVQEFFESNKSIFPQISDTRLVEIINRLQDTAGMVVDGNRQKTVRVRSSKWNEFKNLWEQINRDVRLVYKNIDEDVIVKTVCERFGQADIPVAHTKIERWVYDSENDTVVLVKKIVAGGPAYFQKSGLREIVVRIARDHRWPTDSC